MRSGLVGDADRFCIQAGGYDQATDGAEGAEGQAAEGASLRGMGCGHDSVSSYGSGGA
jgi:hypothetical protein